MKLKDFGPIAAPDIEYLKEQLRKHGWEGLVPSRLNDEALLSLAKDMRYPQIRGRMHWVPEVGWCSEIVSFVVNAIVFGTGRRGTGTGTKTAVTPDGMGLAVGHFQYLVEHEIVSRLIDRVFAPDAIGDAEGMRELAQGA